MQSKSILNLSVLAAGVIAAETFVTLAGATATAAGEAAGVAATDAESGDQFPVTVAGTAVVVAGGAITKGAAVEVGTGGKAVTQSAGVTVGIAVTAAAADGDRIEVLVLPSA